MSIASRLRFAVQMHEAGVRMYRQRLTRERPAASHEEIDELVRRWLRARPGAEHGDAVGTPSTRLG